MCGIIGIAGPDIDTQLGRRMRDSLSHRGPDDQGEWHDPQRGIWLGQRRLAIIDLSAEGHQPMVSHGGRYIITFNGEVYNYQTLRTELESAGCAFRGHSDTEVMLAAIETWGLEAALQRFIGMFAFGLVDLADASVYIVRDRMGVKPLYYAANGHRFAFASELTPLARLPWFDPSLDLDALGGYFRYLAVPAPATVYKGAKKLLPGAFARWKDGELTIKRYWNLHDIAVAAGEAPTGRDIEEAADQLEALLRDSVRLRMIADVPLGSFLSGGVDSSCVTALMQSMSTQPVKTFSVGFAESSHDESGYAAAVARHLGTDHHELRLSVAEATGLIPEILAMVDEPFGDNSLLPTYAVARLAREHITVAMSGDGGDELFGGYPRYFWADRIVNARRKFTPAGAKLVAGMLTAVPAGVWDGPLHTLTASRFSGSGGLSARVRRLADYLRMEPNESFDRMRSAWQREEIGALGLNLAPTPYWADHFPGMDWSAQMMLSDQLHYLPDDILTKVDRATMARSLEAREPLLDHRIVEWSWKCKKEHKLAPSGDRGKLVLRRVLRRYVPDHLIDRPKSGFGLPLAQWLRGGLLPWARASVLDDAQWPDCLDRNLVRAQWSAHLSGAADNSSRLWPVLAFLTWYRAHAV